MRKRYQWVIFANGLDWGTRFALYAKWSSGFWQGYNSVNQDVWRHWIPLFVSGAITALVCPPLEVANKAYLGDKTFPQHLRHNYQSRFHALFKIATTNPFALYKNSFPSIAGSFIQTTFAIGIHDFLMTLFNPILVGSLQTHPDSVKLVSVY